jgi:hypothetical protein
MVNGVYIDEADRQLAHEYISDMLQFLTMLDAADRPEDREIKATTAAFPRDFGPKVQKLSDKRKCIEAQRAELRSRVQMILRGKTTSSDGD